MVAGERDPKVLAGLAKASLKGKREQLTRGCQVFCVSRDVDLGLGLVS